MRKIDRLDGSYARTGSRRIYKRDAWDDIGGSFTSVLSSYYAVGLEKFKRFAVNVWGVDASEKEDREIAEEGLAAMESWMKELGLVMNLSELGVTEEMIEGIADVTIVFDTGYKKLDRTEIIDIFRESLI